MAERPILFTGDMVRAILDGRKTMTRRVMKPQPIPPEGNLARDWPNTFIWGKNRDDLRAWENVMEFNRTGANWMSPFGEKGNRLWVKETFMTNGAECRAAMMASGEIKPDILYRAEPRHAEQVGTMWKWTPSIFMPRWASRITLEVVSVKVERLQDIDEDGAKAEGCRGQWERCSTCEGTGYFGSRDILGAFGPENQRAPNPCFSCQRMGGRFGDPRPVFSALWDSINAKKHPWESNAWVWVVEFRRVP